MHSIEVAVGIEGGSARAQWQSVFRLASPPVCKNPSNCKLKSAAAMPVMFKAFCAIKH